MATMLQSPALSAPTGIRHGFFTRTGGVSTGCYESLNAGVGSNDAPAHVAENRARMAAAVGVLPERLISAYQIHSPVVVTVDKPWDVNARPKADAIVTRVSGLAIAVSTADCGPILFADAQAGVIGAAHAGWRGALSGVAEATISAMEHCGADRSRIVAALGPMIRQQNYEVGPELVAQFTGDDSGNARFFQNAVKAVTSTRSRLPVKRLPVEHLRLIRPAAWPAGHKPPQMPPFAHFSGHPPTGV